MNNPLSLFIYIFITLLLIIILLIFERKVIDARVRNLDLRVHVNGTRGKSTLVKYITEGLRVIDSSVMGKVSGTRAEFLVNGVSETVKRRGCARVQEQFRVISRAAKEGRRSLVLECMSLQPELQNLEARIFKPSIYVISNIRDDHKEHLGIDIDKQAEAICRAIPSECTVVTAEKKYLPLIEKYAGFKKSLVIKVDIPEYLEELESPVYKKYNIALASEVCRLAGVDKTICREIITGFASREESAIKSVSADNGSFEFLDALAVNDVGSTMYFVDYWRSKLKTDTNFSVLFNTRADRPTRTIDIISWIISCRKEINSIFICGDNRRMAERKLKKAGFEKKDLISVKGRDSVNLKEIIINEIPDASLLVGVGNVRSAGRKLLKDYL